MGHQSEPTQLRLLRPRAPAPRARGTSLHRRSLRPAQRSRGLDAVAGARTRRRRSPYTTHHALHRHPPITIMTTYIYETIPQNDGEAVKHYEIKQSMTDRALTRHPETGEPIRRVILGGYGVLKSRGKRRRLHRPAAAPRAVVADKTWRNYEHRNCIIDRSRGAIAAQAARLLRALPLALGIRLHGRRRRVREDCCPAATRGLANWNLAKAHRSTFPSPCSSG